MTGAAPGDACPSADGLPRARTWPAEAARVTEFRERAGIPALIDAHVHFMPERLLAAVWAYFDAAGPLTGRPWPIAYRVDEDAGRRLARSA